MYRCAHTIAGRRDLALEHSGLGRAGLAARRFRIDPGGVHCTLIPRLCSVPRVRVYTATLNPKSCFRRGASREAACCHSVSSIPLFSATLGGSYFGEIACAKCGSFHCDSDAKRRKNYFIGAKGGVRFNLKIELGEKV